MSHTTTQLPSAIPSSAAAHRTFTVRNGCDFKIWPAIFTGLNQASTVPDLVTGWEAHPNTQKEFTVPDNWTGRIWARRSCDFSNNSDEPSSCLDGGCNGGLICDPDTGTGVPPATLAEFILRGDAHDMYDVSLVDGFNLPVYINSTVGCGVASCPKDLNPQCPEALKLKGPVDNTVTLGCNSACSAKIDGKPEDSANCCTGNHSTPETCPSSGVDHYDFFSQESSLAIAGRLSLTRFIIETQCPDTVAYAFDQTSDTAVWTCSSKLKANYTIVFCPYEN